MGALSEEHTGRTVKLRHDHALGTVDDKSALVGHVGNRSEIHVLYHSGEILVVRVGAIELELGLEGHTVGESALQTFVNSVAGRIDVVVEKFEYKVIARVGYGEVLGKNLVKALVVTLLGRCVELKEILEGLQLHLEKIGVREWIFYRRKVNARFDGFDV